MIKNKNAVSSKIISLFRDFQISILEGRKFTISEDSYKKFISSNKYQVYLKNTPNEIITGSNALFLFGLLDRESKDLDIVIPKEKSNQFGSLFRVGYTDELKNYIGSKSIKYKKHIFSDTESYQFDFFELLPNSEILEISDLKLEHPLSIIRRKIEIADNLGMLENEKHAKDIIRMLS